LLSSSLKLQDLVFPIFGSASRDFRDTREGSAEVPGNSWFQVTTF
jgi:hypothetical protein